MEHCFLTFLRVALVVLFGAGSLQSLDVLTINEGLRDREGLVEVIWKAFDYFPRGIWEEANYVGNISVKADLKIKSKDEEYGAFIFSRLMRRVREAKSVFGVEDLLLGVTHDPVIVLYHRFDGDRFRRIVDLVHDYVSDDAGLISLFDADEDVTIRVAAHGLGHNQGLRHHADPVDLMYVGLLNGSLIRVDGFCSRCKWKLQKKKRS